MYKRQDIFLRCLLQGFDLETLSQINIQSKLETNTQLVIIGVLLTGVALLRCNDVFTYNDTLKVLDEHIQVAHASKWNADQKRELVHTLKIVELWAHQVGAPKYDKDTTHIVSILTNTVRTGLTLETGQKLFDAIIKMVEVVIKTDLASQDQTTKMILQEFIAPLTTVVQLYINNLKVLQKSI